MKKALAIILSICFVLCLTACSKNKTPNDVDSSTQTEEKISFSTNSIDLTVGSTSPLKIETNIDINKVVFSSSNEDIAKYFDGEVLGKNKGECTIIATTPNGTKAECVVKVNAKVIYEGKCGENITWKYLEDASLVFSGTGEMQEYYDDIWYQPANVLIPWHTYSPWVKEIVIEEGITSIAAFAFIDCKACKKITIPDSVSKIGYCAFEHWTNYEGFVLGKNITKLGALAFHSCNFDVYYEGTKAEFKNIVKIPPKSQGMGEYFWDEKTQTNVYVPYDDWDSKFEGKLLYYSETKQSDCWHYVDGVPTAW